MNPDSAVQKVAESGAFGALCIVLLIFIWWLIREQNRKDDEHTAQIERINAAHDVNIEKVTLQFTIQIDKMSIMAQADRKESTDAFNKLSNLLASVIEKRGNIDLQDRFKN
jgi:preprotein translocase subunit YajC